MLNLGVVRIVATTAVLAVFVAAAVTSIGSAGRPTFWFPAFVAVAGTIAAAYSLLTDLLNVRRGRSVLEGEVSDLGASVSDGEDEEDGTGRSETPKRVLIWALWLVALPALALVIPFFYASLVWLVAVMRVTARRSWLSVAISVGAFGIVLNVLVVLLEIRMPPALLTGWG
ncbi:hypothetical protein [Microbacterium album]|uniref:Tripartite tricarboxylate transporter TctB family protein n=1 Tax=Microbacterium album TaxID=2053191 RepID=A0A917IET9_9MICO|nr:hypothetical protein [Microbacterium album]GGH36815.1 hypothetical protein GCM10010921_06200 [Microbacterium album]